MECCTPRRFARDTGRNAAGNRTFQIFLAHGPLCKLFNQFSETGPLAIDNKE